MSLDTTATKGLATALAAALAAGGEGGAIGAEIARVVEWLARLDGSVRPSPPTDHPLIARLAPAIAETAAVAPDLARRLTEVAALLPWRYGYAATTDRPGLEAAMGWAEIVGPEAPLRSDEVCLGLTFISAGVTYPAHRHPAIELYRIVAGEPTWTVGEETAIRRPGDAVLHLSGVDHAMACGETAMLAVYSWTGDVVSPSVWSGATV